MNIEYENCKIVNKLMTTLSIGQQYQNQRGKVHVTLVHSFSG